MKKKTTYPVSALAGAVALSIVFAFPASAVELGSNVYNLGSAADQSVVIGNGNTFEQPLAPISSIEGNVVVGDQNTIRAPGNIVVGSDNYQMTTSGNIVVGDRNLVGGPVGETRAVIVGSDSQSQLLGVSVGSGSESRDYSTAIGADSTAGTGSVAIGYQSEALFDNAIAIGSGSQAFGIGAMAIGAGATALQGGIAIGAGSVANQAQTVSFSDGVNLRRLTGIADAIGSSDAVSFSQMSSITGAMSADLASLTSRIVVLEGAPTGGDNSYTDAGLQDANLKAQLGDMETLGEAKSYADLGDAETLRTATLGDARTLTAAKTYADDGDARTLASANAYSRSLVDDLEGDLSGGIAAVASMPAMPALEAGQKAVSVGTGHYNGESALGLAAGFAPVTGLTLSVGVSGAQRGGAVFRSGASYVW